MRLQEFLTLKYKTRLFDNPYPEAAAKQILVNRNTRTLALNAAHEAMTLLKNQNNILPFSKNAKVLVAGPSAQSITALNGCWSYTWQGNNEQWYPSDSKTILQAITDKVGAANVITTTGKGFDNPANYDAAAIKNCCS